MKAPLIKGACGPLPWTSSKAPIRTTELPRSTLGGDDPDHGLSDEEKDHHSAKPQR